MEDVPRGGDKRPFETKPSRPRFLEQVAAAASGLSGGGQAAAYEEWRRRYPFPLLRFPIPKPQHGIRHLAVPTVRVRVAQTAAYLVTKERFEAEFEACSYAFRPGRSVKSAIRRVDELRQEGYRFIVDAEGEPYEGFRFPC